MCHLMMPRLCSRNLLRTVITAAVLECVFRIFHWIFTAASLAIDAWTDFPLLLGLYSQR